MRRVECLRVCRNMLIKRMLENIYEVKNENSFLRFQS